MPKCRICDKQIPPGVDLCPACGAPVPATTKAISAEFEQELLDLLNKGQEPDAVARYREVTGISLGEARTAIQQLRQRSAVADQLGPQLQQELMELLHSGQKIKAIKIYKEQMNCGLAEAKEAVEALTAQQGVTSRGSGCASVLVVFAAMAMGSSALLAWCVTALT